MRSEFFLLACAIVLFVSCDAETPVSEQGLSESPDVISSAAQSESQSAGVETSAERPPYVRANWRHWSDEDGDCQDTRQEVLIAESLVNVTFEDSRNCRVDSGLWFDVYTAKIFTDPSDLDVDHFIPLANAHASGGWQWSAEQKQLFANDLTDPDSLIAVSSGANRSKGASDPSNWKPPNESAWCAYASTWSRLKAYWGLDSTETETRAINAMTGSCKNESDRSWPSNDSSIGIQSTNEQPTSEKNVTGTPTDSSEDRDCGDFGTWHLANEFFVVNGGSTTDYHRLDGDNDGIPCESLPGAP